MPKKPIINAHAHTFTSKFVPPFLAKTIIPWPLYYLVHTQWIVGLAKRYYAKKHSAKFPTGDDKEEAWKAIYASRRKERKKTLFNFKFKTQWFFHIPWRIFIYWLSLVAFFYTVEFLGWILGNDTGAFEFIADAKDFLTKWYLFFELPTIGKVLWAAVVLIFINWSRRTIWFLLKRIFPYFKNIISPKGLALLERYLLMGRFSLYKTQKKVAERALHQMPESSQLVILPMDMEYMGAGKTKMTKEMLGTKNDNLAKGWTSADYQDTFKYQMRELWDFVATNRTASKNANVYKPFLFLDPRRIAKEGTSFFNYTLVNGRMQLSNCFVKTYMEDRSFSGFKIYPALGYYVFDELLLPIWRYAVENNIPIMTHCVVGTIYYRGKKKKEWNFHPVFKQNYKDPRDKKYVPEPMLLPQVKAAEVQHNFTHPMNYLGLLEEVFLRELVGKAKNPATRALYGYTDADTPLTFTLENIKICLAHYGGEEEWIKYLENDRDVYSLSIVKKPDEGIQFIKYNDGVISWHKINELWHDTDWYSLITSILMNYKNMYADLSYIISKPSIFPLLEETLRKGAGYDKQLLDYISEPSDNKKAGHFVGRNRLRSHILYGTDFYVVRNHNSDKDLFTNIRASLDDEGFDLIARENTHNYLSKT